MSKFTRAPHPAFGGSKLHETLVEVGMTVAAAAFTAIIWLSVGAYAVTPSASAETVAVDAPMQITLPTVVIVGRRDVETTPVMTTAQNTAQPAVTVR